MKCITCHKHFKPERTIKQDSICPDCFVEPVGNTVHVVLTELRDIYRKRLEALLQDKNLDKDKN